MKEGNLLQKTIEGVAGLMEAKKVYGEPVEVNNRTVIPVSTAWWCGGGGGGEGVGSPEEGVKGEATGDQEGSGGGFGGFGRVRPVGYIVMEDKGVTWERIIDLHSLMLLAAVVLLCWLRVLRYWIRVKGAQDRRSVKT
jgi:uncharacterized spore protein YtfJ